MKNQKNEQELLSMLRSGLDDHEKRPFEQIRAAIEQEPSEMQSASPKSRWPRYVRPIAAAACLILISTLILSVTFPRLKDSMEPQYASPMGEATDEEMIDMGSEVSPLPDIVDSAGGAGHEDSAAAPDDENEHNFAKEAPADSDITADKDATANYEFGTDFITENLRALLDQFKGQPDHEFNVLVLPPTGDSDGFEYVSQILTAEEIYELAGSGHYIALESE